MRAARLVAVAVPALVLRDRLLPWSAGGYGPAVDRPQQGNATVLTPRASVDVMIHGYRPALHPSAGSPPRRLPGGRDEPPH